jgi:23S rRNA pseudouridine1911/1915/1917 synthase
LRREVVLPPAAAGRLDRALADLLGLGRAAVKEAFRAGAVRVDGRRARASDPARPGARVALEVASPAGPPVPEDWAPLHVLLETPRVVVVDKPAGVASHPLRAGEGGTLANAVAARYPECAAASPEPREGGAAHRLDVETSGCVIFARDRAAWEAVRAQLAARRVEKVYLALVAGRVFTGGTTSIPLAQRSGRAIPVPDLDRSPHGAGRPRDAITHYEVRRALPGYTLLEVRIETGVMHQIRAHLAHLGFPVVGDAVYGGAAARVPGLERHALHAARVGFELPGGGRASAESPWPRELAEVEERLAGPRLVR